MPLLQDLTDPDGVLDPDAVPWRVVAFGVQKVTAGFELDDHRHQKAELLLVLRGVVRCDIADGLWIVPPHHAVWIPPGAIHRIRASGRTEAYVAFVDPEVPTGLPTASCTVSVSALLRELLVRAAACSRDGPELGSETHLVTLLLDELAAAPAEGLHLPMPLDRRLRRIAGMLIADPSARGTAAAWARRAGLSERSLLRLLSRETGMSFGRWRRQLAVMLALQWLAQGSSIQQVAAALGYDSAGSFITMFRKTLGTSPGRYMAGQRRGPAAVACAAAP